MSLAASLEARLVEQHGLLDDAAPFTDVTTAQAAIDAWVAHYNHERPHQSLQMACPADRFTAAATVERDLLPLRLPATLGSVDDAPAPAGGHLPAAPVAGDFADAASSAQNDPADVITDERLVAAWTGGQVEFERVVPASGNLGVAGKQFLLGTARAGVTVTFWADTDVIHLMIAAVRVKTLRSHLSTADLAGLAARGGRAAGPPPLPVAEDDAAMELERTVNNTGLVSLGGSIADAGDALSAHLTVRRSPNGPHLKVV
ncbi:integrase core domain-containing protein [Planotetraspora mira]|uniref:integrase core domain-containing protein n=1 Tax=Planotetraspora mira TaxID=58121 RepID=UPI00366DEA2E